LAPGEPAGGGPGTALETPHLGAGLAVRSRRRGRVPDRVYRRCGPRQPALALAPRRLRMGPCRLPGPGPGFQLRPVPATPALTRRKSRRARAWSSRAGRIIRAGVRP